MNKELIKRYASVVYALCLSVGGLSASAWDIADDWKSGELWKLPRKETIKDNVDNKEVDQDTTSVRAQGVTFGDMVANEILLTWKEAEQETETKPDEQPKTPTETSSATTKKTPKKNDKEKKPETKPTALQRVSLELFNRGDNGDMDKKELAKNVAEYCSQLDELTGVKKKKVRLPGTGSEMKMEAWQWETPNGIARLLAAISFPKTSKGSVRQVRNDNGETEKPKEGKKRGRAEYIRLLLAANSDDLESGGAGDKVTKKDLRSFVVHEEDGTVWIKDIPMVNQGEKGYCVPATVARVFALYGMDSVDMYTMAAVCNTRTSGGTSPVEMTEGLKKIGHRYHVQIKALGGVMDNQSFIKDYNTAAKRKDLPELPGQESWWDGIDPATWVAVRAKKKSDVSRWLSSLRPCIDAGIPILWSVFASNMYTGDGGADLGGPHMRLIIGYNEKKGTIVYSDSWGASAARRIMKTAEAFSITSSTYFVKP